MSFYFFGIGSHLYDIDEIKIIKFYGMPTETNISFKKYIVLYINFTKLYKKIKPK